MVSGNKRAGVCIPGEKREEMFFPPKVDLMMLICDGDLMVAGSCH
jgi:hypothetical protein